MQNREWIRNNLIDLVWQQHSIQFPQFSALRLIIALISEPFSNELSSRPCHCLSPPVGTTLPLPLLGPCIPVPASAASMMNQMLFLTWKFRWSQPTNGMHLGLWLWGSLKISDNSFLNCWSIQKPRKHCLSLPSNGILPQWGLNKRVGHVTFRKLCYIRLNLQQVYVFVCANLPKIFPFVSLDSQLEIHIDSSIGPFFSTLRDLHGRVVCSCSTLHYIKLSSREVPTFWWN